MTLIVSRLTRLKLSRFDGLVILILLGLAAATLLLLWRGDQVGVQVIATRPAAGDDGVSARAPIEITFDQPMVAGPADSLLRLTPPVSGTTRWEGTTLIFTPSQPLQAGVTYTVELAAPLTSQRGRQLANAPAWRFTTRQPAVLYVAPDDAGHDQLFVIDPGGGPPSQLTREEFGIFDYQVSPDATQIVYAALREDGGSDLWAISPAGHDKRPLLTCAEAVCSGASWSPDGRQLVYERRSLLADGAAPGPPRLWYLDLPTGETVQLFDNSQVLGYGATWSASGTWLSYVTPTNQGVQIYNIEDGSSIVIPSRMGGLAVWHPVEDTFLVTDIQTSDAGFAVHLLKASPNSGNLTDLSGPNEAVEDSSPAWSPDGEWVAFTRKVAGAAMGKQLWLMRADGSETHFLTNNTNIHHGLPRWSPAGRTLVYQRFPLKEINPTPSLWLFDTQSGQSRALVEPGSRPVWLP